MFFLWSEVSEPTAHIIFIEDPTSYLRRCHDRIDDAATIKGLQVLTHRLRRPQSMLHDRPLLHKAPQHGGPILRRDFLVEYPLIDVMPLGN